MKLAILGTGKIVHEALFALQYVKSIHVSAIWCRPGSVDKAKVLAKQYAIDMVCTDYDALLRQQEIDFVYVGLINLVHYEFARKALLAGKNVILEKPFCTCASEAKDLAETALQKHLYLFEAVTFLHAPFFQIVKDTIPRIAKIKIVQCNYSKYSTRYDCYLQGDVAPVFDPQRAGGTLYDINIYNLNFVVSLFGMPKMVHYVCNRGFNGVDTSGIALLSYSDFLCECVGAKDSDSPSFMMAQGEKGWLRIDGSPDHLKEMKVCIGQEVKTYDLQSQRHRMVDEFLDFQRTFEKGNFERMKFFLNTSIAVAQVAEAAILDAGLINNNCQNDTLL